MAIVGPARLSPRLQRLFQLLTEQTVAAAGGLAQVAAHLLVPQYDGMLQLERLAAGNSHFQRRNPLNFLNQTAAVINNPSGFHPAAGQKHQIPCENCLVGGSFQLCRQRQQQIADLLPVPGRQVSVQHQLCHRLSPARIPVQLPHGIQKVQLIAIRSAVPGLKQRLHIAAGRAVQHIVHHCAIGHAAPEIGPLPPLQLMSGLQREYASGQRIDCASHLRHQVFQRHPLIDIPAQELHPKSNTLLFKIVHGGRPLIAPARSHNVLIASAILQMLVNLIFLPQGAAAALQRSRNVIIQGRILPLQPGQQRAALLHGKLLPQPHLHHIAHAGIQQSAVINAGIAVQDLAALFSQHTAGPAQLVQDIGQNVLLHQRHLAEPHMPQNALCQLPALPCIQAGGQLHAIPGQHFIAGAQHLRDQTARRLRVNAACPVRKDAAQQGMHKPGIAHIEGFHRFLQQLQLLSASAVLQKTANTVAELPPACRIRLHLFDAAVHRQLHNPLGQRSVLPFQHPDQELVHRLLVCRRNPAAKQQIPHHAVIHVIFRPVSIVHLPHVICGGDHLQ